MTDTTKTTEAQNTSETRGDRFAELFAGWAGTYGINAEDLKRDIIKAFETRDTTQATEILNGWGDKGIPRAEIEKVYKVLTDQAGTPAEKAKREANSLFKMALGISQ